MSGPPLGTLGPAALFDALAYGRHPALQAMAAERFEVVAAPGQVLMAAVQPGDVLLWRALGEGGLGSAFMVAAGHLDDADGITAAGYAPDGEGAGYFAYVEPPTPATARLARRIVGTDGRLPADRMLLRPRRAGVATEHSACRCPDDPMPTSGPAGWASGGGLTETVHTVAPVEVAVCTPAPEPDPTGRGPHPPVLAGSNRSSVGYAQVCLNNWMSRFQAGKPCLDTSPATRQFVEAAFARLSANGQLPLVVDCRFGQHTDRATRAFQACKGIGRDGKIGPITWPLLTAYASGAAPPVAAPAFQLLVDADRNGTLVPVPASWTWGTAGQGAVVLVNNDDDGVNGRPDNEDAAIDSGTDIGEVAPLVLAAGGPVPPGGVDVEIRVSDRDSLRIFEANAIAAQEIIGPARGDRFTFRGVTQPRIELAMEGLRYPGRGFSGEVTITVTSTPAGGGSPTTSSTVVRVAPWIVANHLDGAETVFVADAGGFNDRFRRDLGVLVAAAGCRLVEHPISHLDVWVQDCMEFGFASTSSATLRTVLQAPRDRELLPFPRSLLGDDMGFVAQGSVDPFTTYDSTGNLEATPPVTSAVGKHYPLGRIYFCKGTTAEPFDPGVRDFLRAQVVQDPIELDVTWLTVGHVDEVISFVPATAAPGFALLLASPRLGYQILGSVAASNPTARILVARTFPVQNGPPATVGVERSVTDFLALDDDFHPDMRAVNPGRPAASLRRYNDARQADLDALKAVLLPELGLEERHVVEIPSLFMPNPFAPPLADALTGGMVNMLVLNRHCIVPKPFGPVVGGVDQFEKDVGDKLRPLGLTVEFLDCWDEYHVNLGEIHCATNTLRRAPAARWWEFQP